MTQSNGFISVTLPSDFFQFVSSISFFFVVVVVMESCVCIIDRLFQDWIEWIHFTNPIRQQYPVEFQSPSPSQLLRKTLPMESNEKRKIDRINVIDPVLNYLVKFPTINAVFFFFFFLISPKNFVCCALSNFNTAVAHPHLTVQENKTKIKKESKFVLFLWVERCERESLRLTQASINQK